MSPAEGFYSEKRSKFYAFAHHVDSVDEAKTLLAEYRQRYHDARHVCWAYRLGYDGSEYRYNDDGEPSATAGKPIYGQIVSNNLTFTAVFVIRYFGGVKLGTPGLIVAYRTAAADAIHHATIVTQLIEATVTYQCTYPMLDRVLRTIREMSGRIVQQQFDTSCTITICIVQSKEQQLRQRLQQLAFE